MKKVKPTVLRGRDLEIETTNSDVVRLRSEKDKLLKDIKRLGDIFFGLKKAKEESEKKFDDYATSRVMALEHIAREVSDELKVRAEELSKRAVMIDKRNKRLDSLKKDLDRRESFIEASDKALTDLSESLSKQKDSIDSDRKKLSQMQGKMGGKMSNIAKREKEIDGLYAKAEKLVSFFEKEADKEREELTDYKDDLKRKELDLKGREKALKIKGDTIHKRLIQARESENSIRVLIATYNLDKDKIPKKFRK